MASQVSIVNRALIKLGEQPILLLTDNVKQARTMAALFDDTRDAEIRAHRWKFAMRRTRLSALAQAPDWGYQLQYELPADFLGLVQVNEMYLRTGMKQRAPWAVEGRRLLTDLAAPLAVRYVARVTDASLFDPLFVDALACRLAMEACEAQTQSDTKFQRVAGMYDQALKLAIRQDSVEAPPDELPDGTWLESRQGAGYAGIGPDGGLWPSGVTVL
jgi:hypothetical protein